MDKIQRLTVEKNICFCIKNHDFNEFWGFPLAKIEILTRKFQGMSMIRETAKIKNANFEVKVYEEISFHTNKPGKITEIS